MFQSQSSPKKHFAVAGMKILPMASTQESRFSRSKKVHNMHSEAPNVETDAINTKANFIKRH